MKECQGCSEPLVGRKTKWCSNTCSKRAGRETYLLRRYGITSLQFDELWEYQGKVCAVCGQKPRGNRKPVVDHEHSGGPSGRVRGIICNMPCNLKLISKHRDSTLLQAAADYLRDPPAVELFGEIIAPGKPKKKRKSRKRKQ